MFYEIMIWILIFVSGALLGIVYFGGLLLTIRQITQSKRPALIMILSLFTRVAVVVSGFYWLTGGQWRELIVALIGFISIRMLMVRRFGPLQASTVISP